MVGSGIGRHDLARLRDRRLQVRPLPEAHDGDVRKPGPSLSLVDAQLLETLVQIGCETPRSAAEVFQGEHPDAPGLAISLRHEPDRVSACGGFAQCCEDRLELHHRAVPEEGERDVQVAANDRPA